MVLVSDRGAGLLIRKDGISIGSSSINDDEFFGVVMRLTYERKKSKRKSEEKKDTTRRTPTHSRTHEPIRG